MIFAIPFSRQAGPYLEVRIRDVATGQFLWTLGSYAAISGIALSPKGNLIAISKAPEYGFNVYSVQTGKELYGLTGGRDTHLLFSPNGTTLFSGSWESVNLWSIENGKVLHTLNMPQDYSSSVFSPDSRMIATGSYEGTIWLWDVATGQLVRSLEVVLDLTGQSEVEAVAFSLDGQLLVSGTRDGTVNVWEVSTGHLLRTLSMYADLIIFSPDGRMMVLGSQDGTVRLLGVPPD